MRPTAPDRLQRALLIALDWGSSALRAYALGAGGRVLAHRHSGHGVLHLPAASPGRGPHAAFEQALQALCGDWLGAHARLPLLACGMVGSAQGWQEAPYRRLPLALRDWQAPLTVAAREGAQALHIVPGLLQDGALPEVMRGEETQIAGVVHELARTQRLPRRLLIGLPGTHCKWRLVEDGNLQRFCTFMTGELFSLLRRHSILGRTMAPPGAPDPEAFALGLGVAPAPHGRLGLLSSLFSCRTLGLVGRLAPGSQPDYLSGLLIGHELHALAAVEPDALGLPVVLCGDAALCRRYAGAFTALGLPPPAIHAGASAMGLWRIALSSGLVQPASALAGAPPAP